MNNNTKCFFKGVGAGMAMGSALNMVVTNTASEKKSSKSGAVSKAFKTMGDIVENIGDSIGL